MPVFEPNLPARQVHDCFARTLLEAEAVQRNLVLWFADLYRRKLYLELGYTSIFAYTAERHGFSKSKCVQFIRLAESLKRLPALHDSLAAGEMPWTKAREVVKVATPETERAWVNEARHSSRRALERKIAEARGRAGERRGPGRDQGMLELAAVEPAEPVQGPEGRDGQVAGLVQEIPEEVRLRFPVLQFAEYGALVEKLRKQGWKGPVEDLIVAGLAEPAGVGRMPGEGPKEPAALVSDLRASSTGVSASPTAAQRKSDMNGGRSGANSGDGNPPATLPDVDNQSARGTRVSARAAFQVIVRFCPRCNPGDVQTGRGSKPLQPAELEAVLCDARIQRRGEKNRAVIPPALHRKILERDGHRCRIAGCESARFLSVHHRTPRSAGGTNAPENLVTLCASCHRALHGMAERARREVLRAMPERRRWSLPRVPGYTTR